MKESAQKYVWITLIVAIFFSLLMVGYVSFHSNKPIFDSLHTSDDFNDQIPGIFPAGWWSGVNPQYIRVTNIDDNNALQISDHSTSQVTEVMKKFKKASKGKIECDVMIDKDDAGFVIHIPQKDADYNPYDDIIIVFLNENIYVIDDENIIEIEDNGQIFQLIDEWNLEDESIPISNYEKNTWIHIKIVFTTEHFDLVINDVIIGTFNYPRHNPSYLCSVYFWTLIESSDFNLYVDNVDILIEQIVDFIHPLNVVAIISILSISCLFIYSVLKFRLKLK